MSPKVSVIIPVYNVAAFLGECVESVLGQTYGNLEIILVDDGSTDGSETLCDAYADRDTRIRVIHQENRGVCEARNAALDAAIGKYVQFVDADDWIDSETTDFFVREMDAHDVQLVIGSLEHVHRVDADTRHNIPVRYTPGIKDAKSFAIVSNWSVPNAHYETSLVCGRLFDRSVIESHRLRFRPDLYFQEDIEFLMRYYSVIRNVLTCDRVLYHYRRFDTSASGERRFRRDWIRNDETVCTAIAATIGAWPGLERELKAEAHRHLLNRHAMTAISSLFLLCARESLIRSRSEIRRLVASPLFQQSLREYVPAKGFSRAVPFFLRWKMPLAAYLAIRWHVGWKKFLKSFSAFKKRLFR